MVTLYIILKIKEILFSTLHVGKSTSLEITSNAIVSGTKNEKKVSSIYSVCYFYVTD